MPFRVRLIEERGRVRIRDGATLADPMVALSATEWATFQNRPRVEDPNLIIEEITEPPKPKRRRGRPPKVKVEATA